MQKVKSYPYSDGQARKAPSHARVVAGLSDREIADEIEQNRGEPEFQAALRAEQAHREQA